MSLDLYVLFSSLFIIIILHVASSAFFHSCSTSPCISLQAFSRTATAADGPLGPVEFSSGFVAISGFDPTGLPLLLAFALNSHASPNLVPSLTPSRPQLIRPHRHRSIRTLFFLFLLPCARIASVFLSALPATPSGIPPLLPDQRQAQPSLSRAHTHAPSDLSSRPAARATADPSTPAVPYRLRSPPRRARSSPPPLSHLSLSRLCRSYQKFSPVARSVITAALVFFS